MRSPDDDMLRQPKQTPIPDKQGASAGLLGIKTPFGRGQLGDIEDRLTAAGILKQPAPQLKR